MTPPARNPNNTTKSANKNKKRKNKKKKQNKSNAPATPNDEVQVASAGGNNSNLKIDQRPKKSTPKENHTIRNPLLEEHKAFMRTKCSPHERDNFFSNTLVDTDRRAELWMEQADAGEALVNKYSWAIPNDRALRILKSFSPLVEIGCGSNAYWCRMMTQAGIDVVGYDMHPEAGGQISHSEGKKKKKKRKRESDGSFLVRQGGPEVLATKEIRKSGRTLFLCYSDEEALQAPPDEHEDDGDEDNEEDRMTTLGVECLKNYTGDYIIHVGELFGDTISIEQGPWGRSSGPAFQQQLAATFHCILRSSLPNWIHVRDTISVWKRSETCSIVFAADSDEEEEDDEGDIEVEYRHIPVSERLPTDIAAPCLAHLLQSPTSAAGEEVPIHKKVQVRETIRKNKNASNRKGMLTDSDESKNDQLNEGSSSEDVSDGQPQMSPMTPSKKTKITKKDSSSDEDEKEEDYVVEW